LLLDENAASRPTHPRPPDQPAARKRAAAKNCPGAAEKLIKFRPCDVMRD